MYNFTKKRSTHSKLSNTLDCPNKHCNKTFTSHCYLVQHCSYHRECKEALDAIEQTATEILLTSPPTKQSKTFIYCPNSQCKGKFTSNRYLMQHCSHHPATVPSRPGRADTGSQYDLWDIRGAAGRSRRLFRG